MTKGKAKPTLSKKPAVKPALPMWPFSERATFLLFAGVALVLTLILFAKYLFGPNLYIFNDAGSDTITVFYPNLVQASRYFQEEGWPGWSFYMGLGTNIYPGFLLNPFHWIYLHMDAVHIAYAVAWVQAAILYVTGLVFYRFLKEAEFALPVRFFGGIAYAFGGYMVLGNTWYGHADDIFWMTSAILGFELLLRRKIWWLFPIPFVFLMGPRGYFLILFLAVYSLVRMLDVYGSSWRAILHGYKRMFIAGLIGVCLIMPFVGGKWHKFENSPRVTGDVSYSDRLSDQPVFGMSVIKHNVTAVLRTFSNDTMGGGTDYKGWRNYLEAPCFYFGLLMLLMVFQFFAVADRRQRWIYGLFLLLWFWIILFPWFRYAFYGFAGNYYKGALSLFIPFSFLFVALKGMQEIVNGKRVNQWVLFLSSAMLLILLWYPYQVEGVEVRSAIQLKASGFIIAYTALLWMLAAGIGSKVMYPTLIVLASAEALWFAWPAIHDRDALLKSDIHDKKFHFDDSMEAVQKIHERDHDLFYRTDKVFGSIKTGYNDGMVQGFFGTKTYQSHNHKQYVEFLDKVGVIDGSKEQNTRWLIGVSRTNLLHGLFSIKYLLSNAETQEFVDPAIYTPVDTTGTITTSLNQYYIPFGIPMDAYVTKAEFEQYEVPGRRRVLYFGVVAEDGAPWTSKLRHLQMKQDEFFGTATRDRVQSLVDSAMTMDYFSHNLIKGHITVSNPSMLFFSMPFDVGWKATADGVPVELQKVDIGFTGMMLEPGTHQIILKYEPPLSREGWFGWIGAALGVLLLIVFRKKF